jgi:lipopolysaccharide transport system permease protein
MPNSTIPITIIEPKKGWIPVDLTEIWNYRELLYFLTKRDIKVRYKQTVLGGLWAIIQPVFTMVVFTRPISLMPYLRLETVSLEARIS